MASPPRSGVVGRVCVRPPARDDAARLETRIANGTSSAQATSATSSGHRPGAPCRAGFREGEAEESPNENQLLIECVRKRELPACFKRAAGGDDTESTLPSASTPGRSSTVAMSTIARRALELCGSSRFRTIRLGAGSHWATSSALTFLETLRDRCPGPVAAAGRTGRLRAAGAVGDPSFKTRGHLRRCRRPARTLDPDATPRAGWPCSWLRGRCI